MCRFLWLYDLYSLIFVFVNPKCYSSVTCSNCTVQYSTIYEDWENNCLDVLMCVLPVCGHLPPPPSLVLSEFQCDQALCTLSQKAGSFLVTLIGECQIINLLYNMVRFTLN